VFDFLPTAYVVHAGHRLRISVAGADYRERDRAPAADPATIVILDDKTHPSIVSLPVIPKRAS
jgi:predicted acyl esterase